MDLLKSMRIFMRIVEAGSMTGAAERSNISVAMVSNHLRFLESYFNTKILHRTTRSQKLTEFGVFYYDRCKIIVDMIDETEIYSTGFGQEADGLIRITMPRIYGHRKIMPRISEFYRSYPSIELDITLSDEVIDLVSEGYDAAIRIGELPDSDLIARPLTPYRLVICASPDYLAARGWPMTPFDLEKHECLALMFPWSSEWRAAQREWRFRRGEDEEKMVYVPARLKISDAAALRECVLGSLGIAMLPEVLVSDDLETNRLVRLLNEYELPSRPVHLLYHASPRLTARLQVFIDFICQNFGRS